MSATTAQEATISEARPARQRTVMQAGVDPLLRAASVTTILHGLLWGYLLFRWMTFSRYEWTPYAFELVLADFSGAWIYVLLSSSFALDLLLGFGLWREWTPARWLGLIRSMALGAASLVYFAFTGEFYGMAIGLAIAGLLFVLLSRHAAWSLAYPAAFWLLIFFVIPMLIVLIVSFGERARLGTVSFPPIALENWRIFLNDYIRFFSPVGGEYLYLRIFGRSVWLATLNTVLCLAISYPFAYWIARRPARWRGFLIFLVMIPFWTNFLVRTYAWMLILRDTGVINSFWTVTLHQQALQLADISPFFAWLASISADPLPLLFNQGAVLVGLFYGYFPFMVLPLYSNLEKIDWSLLEAASDLGANTLQTTVRVLLPLSAPGIVAGSIIVFIPSLGAYVTPDLLGGARVALVGNLLQQQFMTVRDWPFGSAIGFILMAIMLVAVMVYFRLVNSSAALTR